MTKKKTPRPRSSSRHRRRTLGNDACPACGTPMIEKRATLQLPVNGEETAVPAAAHLSCPKCGEILLRYQDSKRLGEDAIAIYRKKHGLLSADDIRAIRDRFDLTQARPRWSPPPWSKHRVPLGVRSQRPVSRDGHVAPSDPRRPRQHPLPSR
jgi:YgiT-type zinc finger domain-containing protein